MVGINAKGTRNFVLSVFVPVVGVRVKGTMVRLGELLLRVVILITEKVECPVDGVSLAVAGLARFWVPHWCNR